MQEDQNTEAELDEQEAQAEVDENETEATETEQQTEATEKPKKTKKAKVKKDASESESESGSGYKIPKAGTGRRGFTPEEVREMRTLRAERHPDGRPVHSHNALAKRFNTAAGTVSQIVRNRSYRDENYTPVNERG
jgi:hypothetical protein